MARRLHNLQLRQHFPALQREVLFTIVAGCVERFLVPDDEHAAGSRLERMLHFLRFCVFFDFPFEASKERLVGQLAAVVPVHVESWPTAELWKLKVDDRPLGIGFSVVAAGQRLHAGWIAEVQRHEWHIERMACHIAQRTGAKIPIPTPRKRMIARTKRPHGRRADPRIPVQIPWHGSFCRPIASLRPHWPVGPNVQFLDNTQGTRLDHRRGLPQ